MVSASGEIITDFTPTCDNRKRYLLGSMNPPVSIIIPTYNRCHLIGETMDSIIAQTYKNWECIVVDDGSTDHTRDLLEFYSETDSRIQFHHRPKNRTKGANACRNYGFEVSKGEFILFFDSDDLINPNIILLAVEEFIQNKNIGFVFYNYLEFEKRKSNIVLVQNNQSNIPFLDYFGGKINLATPAILWKREVISNFKFNEKLKKTQELDYVFRIFKSRKKIDSAYLDEYGFYYRKHSNSILNSFFNKTPEFLYSDAYVRSQIIFYFRKDINEEIYNVNRIKLDESIWLFFQNAEIKTLFNKIQYINLEKKSFSLKFRLIIFKIVKSLYKREYRFNKTAREMLNSNLYITKC